MVRRTHNILQWLFAIFLLYLLLTRIFISWAQFYPEQLVNSVDIVTGIEVDFNEIDLQQNWSGFSIKLESFTAKDKSFVFQAEKLEFDFNFFFFALPSIDYGDNLYLKNGAYQVRRAHHQSREDLAYLDPEKTMHALSEININIERLWKKVRFENFIISELSPGLAIQLNEFHSLKKSYLSVVSEFSLSYGDVLNYEPFNLRATLNSNVWGAVDSGDVSLSSFKPLKVERIAQLLPKSWQGVLPNGEFILDLQSSFANARLLKSVVNLNTQSLQWKQAAKDLPKSMGLQFEWKRNQQNIDKKIPDWEFDLSQIQINNKYVDAVAPIKIKFAGGDLIRFSSEKFDLEPFEVMIKALMENKLAGDVLERAVRLSINDLTGQFNWKTLELNNISLFFRRLDLPVTDLPGMSLQDLRLIKDKQKLTIESSKPVWVLEPKVNPKPMKVELPGSLTLSFNKINHAWSLPQLNIKVNTIPVGATISQINNDYIDAEFTTQFSSMAQLKQYLPYGLMSNKLQTWLKASLTGGQDIILDGQIRGLYKNFPYSDNNGHFKLKAQVKNAKLKFDKKWPELSGFDAELFFKPYRLDIRSRKVNLGNGNIGRDVVVSIPDLNKKDIELSISGEVNTDLVNAVDYLQSSPIAKQTGIQALFDSGAEFSGKTRVSLQEVKVPISGLEGKDETVKGSFWLSNSGLKFNENINFSGINGKFDFNNQQLNAKSIRFKSFDGDGQLSIKTNTAKKTIQLDAKGQALKNSNIWFSEPLSWQASLNIPFKQSSSRPLELAAKVAIDKAQSKMPFPFDVNSLQKKPLVLNAQVSEKGGNLQYQLDNLIKGRARYTGKGDDVSIQYLQTSIGNSKLKSASQQGSYIIGDLTSLDLEEWLSFYQKIPKSSHKEKGIHSFIADLDWKQSELNIAEFEYLANQFKNMKVSWLLNDSPLQISFDSKRAQGEVEVKDAENIHINLQKLYLHYPQDAKPETVDEQPSNLNNQCKENAVNSSWPKIQFTGKNIFIDDREIEKLAFSITETDKERRVDKIKGSYGRGAGQVTGNYIYNKINNRSQLQSEFTSSKVDEVMKFLKINKGFSGNKAEVSLALGWLGSHDCFSLKNAKGNIAFSLSDGSIEDVEPGLARLIGLLSVESLVRRLKLDLKDVTNKGLVYDSIKGKGLISNGQLKLNKFEMKAPSANAQLEGRLDLTKETFDLMATVTPKLGSTIPTIAALAGSANPLAALAVYTILKILPDVNENLVSYEYQVKGPWEKPIIESVQELTETNQAVDDAFFE